MEIITTPLTLPDPILFIELRLPRCCSRVAEGNTVHACTDAETHLERGSASPTARPALARTATMAATRLAPLAARSPERGNPSPEVTLRATLYLSRMTPWRHHAMGMDGPPWTIMSSFAHIHPWVGCHPPSGSARPILLFQKLHSSSGECFFVTCSSVHRLPGFLPPWSLLRFEWGLSEGFT
jgi:hypothetical protein